MADRSTQDIKASIEANRIELGRSLDKLKAEVAVATDWRGQIAKHQRQFVIGGGIAALGGLRRRGR